MSEQIISQLGSLFMVGLPGTAIDDSTIRLVSESRIHNFILFSRNVESRPQLRDLCASLKNLCLSNNLPAPLISIDQEGGTVARLPPPFSQFPDQRVIATGDNCEEGLLDYARVCATELKEMGVNMNLAPVLDVCPIGENFFMEHRCLGEDPELVAKLGALVIQEMQKQGVAACAKHFPGLGKAVLDPHLELPVVSTDKVEMAATDFVPFKVASTVGVAAFMTSHTIYEGLDASCPATLSPLILSKVLREEVGYKGLVITDDLEMGAIENSLSIEDAALQAFVAGADLLLICEDHQKVRKSLSSLQQAFNSHIFKPGLVENSVSRQNVVRERFK